MKEPINNKKGSVQATQRRAKRSAKNKNKENNGGKTAEGEQEVAERLSGELEVNVVEECTPKMQQDKTAEARIVSLDVIIGTPGVRAATDVDPVKERVEEDGKRVEGKKLRKKNLEYEVIGRQSHKEYNGDVMRSE